MEESSNNFGGIGQFSDALGGFGLPSSCAVLNFHVSDTDGVKEIISGASSQENCLGSRANEDTPNESRDSLQASSEGINESVAKCSTTESNALSLVKVKEDVDDLERNEGKDLFVAFEKDSETVMAENNSEGLNNDVEKVHDDGVSNDGISALSEVPTKEVSTFEGQPGEDKELAGEEQDVKINVTEFKNKKKYYKKKKVSSISHETLMLKHPLLPPCQCNKRKCGEKFSYDIRQHLHDQFWTMNMYERREWTSQHLLYLKPKSRTNKPISTLHESHRKFFLPNSSEKLEVCRRMFFSTLGFKDEAKFLQNPKLLNKQGTLSKTRKRKCVMSRKNLDAVESYCKELKEQHGSIEHPAANAELVIPTGFSLREMYNDFCTKKSVSSFGYHKFRQILELIMTGESVEDNPYADLRDDEDIENEECLTRRKRKKIVPSNIKEKKSKEEKLKSKDAQGKINGKKKKKTQNSLPKKNRSILKLPLFDEVKSNFLNKRKSKKVLPDTSNRSNRYNFRNCITPVKTYCEDDLMENTLDSEDDTYDDMIRVTFEESKKVIEVEKEKPKVKKEAKAKKVKIKIKIKNKIKIKVKEKMRTKEKKDIDKKFVRRIKEWKPRKKRSKTAERLEAIRFAESRKKTGSNHPVLPPCNCNLRKCHEKIPENQRQIIHDNFWQLVTKQEKKKWVEKHVMHCKPRSRSNLVKFPRKHFFRRYSFPTEDGKMTSVCRIFFMRTLGYHSNMTIDCMDMVPKDATKHTAQTNETAHTVDADGEHSDSAPRDKEHSSDKAAQEDPNPSTGGKENDADDNFEGHLDETGNSQYLFGPKPEEAAKFVFFTPEIEKEEVEKVSKEAVRRRRPLSQRNSKEHHPMREPCSCAKKCPEKFPHSNREAVHDYYWSLITYNQRKQWILDHIKREVPKRRTVLTGPVRKKETRRCYLPSLDGTKVEVCRAFFLSTLGFKWDKMIDTICKTTPQDSKYVRADQRGKRAPVHKLHDVVLESIKEYLESILQTIPFIPPQPRDPLKRSGSKKKKSKTANQTQQSGLTIKTLYADYKLKHPNQKVSYASFRKVHCQVRDQFKVQHPGYHEEPSAEMESAHSQSLPIQDAHNSDMSVSPGSDNGFDYEPNDTAARQIPNTTVSPLQSCMYNEEPQLLNLSYANNMSKPTNHHLEVNPRLGQPSGIKFSKTQDFHLLPFSSYDKSPPKGQSMYQIPGHSSANIMPQYPSAQNTPLDPFYMASSSQAMSNPIAYSNLHFPSDLINHPHLHHPAHHHAHLYQSTLPYRDHNRFPGSVLPQALKEQDHNHHFYNHQMEFGQNHHHTGQDNSNLYSFKDTMPYQSFTPDNVTQSPVPNQMPNQLSYPGNNVNLIEQRNSNSSQPLSAGGFIENPNNTSACSVPNVKVPTTTNYQAQSQCASARDSLQDQYGQKDLKQIPDQKPKKKSSRKSKKVDVIPKVPKMRKVRPPSNRNSKEHHPMLPPCTCGKKCLEKIDQTQREVAYDAFWELGSYNNRKQWIAERMKREDPKRRTNLEALVMRKKETRRFSLPNSSGEMVEVCRLFFLHTLGLKWDKMIGTICKTTARDEAVVSPDMRGKKPPAHKLDDEISKSVESYAQALLQAAKPEYLANVQQLDNPKKFSLDTFIPYGLTMKNLHQDYKAKHASHKVSYESFRKIFRHVRTVVLDPNAVEKEDKEDGDSNSKMMDDNAEIPQGTINAATGHIDSTF